jgi:hypothetical protein
VGPDVKHILVGIDRGLVARKKESERERKMRAVRSEFRSTEMDDIMLLCTRQMTDHVLAS